jgi:hypothetical protein
MNEFIDAPLTMQILKTGVPEGSHILDHKLLSADKWLIMYASPEGMSYPVIIDLNKLIAIEVVT